MSAQRRVALLVLPAFVGMLAHSLPGRAQTVPVTGQFAFADTTLLRDTLGLDFRGLFETADSLRAVPDSLRALMIRYRMPMGRLLSVLDSLAMPLDSLGPTLERERFNPLAQRAPGARPVRAFTYNSGYNIQRTSTSWSNGGDFNLTQGPTFVRNLTTTAFDRYQAGGATSLRQTRESNTELGYRLGPTLSFGGRANLSRFFTSDPGGSNEGEVKNEFLLSSRYKSQTNRRLSSEFNGFGGVLDLSNRTLIKRGLSGSFDSRVRVQRGAWFSHDLSGGVNGNLARTRRPELAAGDVATRDLAGSLSGTLAMWPGAPAGLDVTYSARSSRVETPTESLTVNRIISTNRSARATLRLRQATDRTLDVIGSLGRSSQIAGARRDGGLQVRGRYTLAGFRTDANFGDSRSRSDFPRARRTYGYIEEGTSRSADATTTRSFGRFVAKVNTSISLNQFRYTATADSATPPSPRDTYRQNYRTELLYNRSDRLNSAVALDVSLNRTINLLPQSVASNNDARSYRAEWRWSYRMLRGLSVTQTNSINADYRFYPFAPTRDDLSLDYNTITNLSAILSPRLTMDLQHVAREQPRGNYQQEPGAGYVFLPADANLNYTLRSTITYTPSSALSVSLRPEYAASDRNGTVNGAETPERQNRRLSFSGGVNLNMTVGSKGQLTGSIQRTYNADRSITFTEGAATPQPRSETDFWNGSLQFSWRL